MKKKISLSLILSVFIYLTNYSQNLQVETIADLNASGGVTFGPDGNIYVSDFGASLSAPNSNTNVYQIEYGTWNVTEFASGFTGASGSRFDTQGNFYQSNNSGAQVSKRTPDGTVTYNWATGMNVPIGLTSDSDDNIYVCNCGANTIRKITPDGNSTLFASGALFNCPNGLTIDNEENLYACNFSDGRIIKITPNGTSTLFKTLPIFSTLGNGHLTFKNGFLFVTTIGHGQIYKINMAGEEELIAGVSQGFANDDGPALEATFSKPNGIAASITGDTLFVNCSIPTWVSNSSALHPGLVRMITGVCSLEDVDCPLLINTANTNIKKNQNRVLLKATPNPVKLETTLSYTLKTNTSRLNLKIYDASNKEIFHIKKAAKMEGEYKYKLDVSEWTSGIYHAVLETDDSISSYKIVIIE